MLQEKELGETRSVCVGTAGVIGGLESDRCACVERRGVARGNYTSVENGRVAAEIWEAGRFSLRVPYLMRCVQKGCVLLRPICFMLCL